jgi:hypothetical protein
MGPVHFISRMALPWPRRWEVMCTTFTSTSCYIAKPLRDFSGTPLAAHHLSYAEGKSDVKPEK